MLKVLGFYCVFTPVSTWLGNYLAETLLWNEYLVTALNMVANFVLEFLYDRFFVFRGSIDTNAAARGCKRSPNDPNGDDSGFGPAKFER